jgi:hypothetical protein
MHIPLKTIFDTIPGFFGIRTEEEPQFEVLFESSEGFEIRRYVATLQAQTVVAGDRDHAANEGFRRLAGYIFGGNERKQEMSMTTPVLQGPNESLGIAMTTPLLQEQMNGSWLISFVLPSELTVMSAPKPQDERVKIVTVAPKTIATLRYSGNNSAERMQLKAQELLTLAQKHGFVVTSNVTWAQYDQPFAIPFLKRNEAHVEVATKN